jgi:molybdopterin-biosynthesis enzyme MoeA-like protein
VIRKEDLNEARKRMAYFPEGSQIHYPSKDYWTPLVQVKNVYILPGIPQLFKVSCFLFFKNATHITSKNVNRNLFSLSLSLFLFFTVIEWMIGSSRGE